MTNAENTKTHTDIKTLIWVEHYLPSFLRPYAYAMRLDRPIGIWLLLFPALWSLALTSNGIRGITPELITTAFLFAVGAVIMRGAGCIINDLWDRDLDKMVERTKNRPIASGQISVKNAVIFLVILLALGLIILLQFNRLTIGLGILSLFFVIAYPLMKRITWWPQAFLGFTFNFGVLMGWSAMEGTLAPAAYILYIAAFFWTLGYDTIYAHQDIDDDVLAGIKSTARLFKDKSKAFVGTCYALSTLLMVIAAALTTDYLTIGLTALSGLMLAWQVHSWEPNNAENSLQKFKSNRSFAFNLFLLLMLR